MDSETFYQDTAYIFHRVDAKILRRSGGPKGMEIGKVN